MNSLKDEGAVFWNQNPCGGKWKDYRHFIDWYTSTEPYLLEILDPIALNGKRVLDVGCGQGVMCNLSARKNASVVGIDMSFSSLRASKQGARELGVTDNVHFVQADAENLPFRSSAFDTVLSIGVLHHTPNIQNGINEIQRIIQVNGQIIIMLYRRGNPKWWMTKSIRTVSKVIKSVSRKTRMTKGNAVAPKGTALQELLDVPIMNAYSNHESARLFSSFRTITISNYQPGFARLVDFQSWLKIFTPFLKWIDIHTKNQWGFYQVIKAKK
jgi:2-polyprenyl-3-methyl-5-hydroxy-6-metoxy-1,4-benzoquinol methylase